MISSNRLLVSLQVHFDVDLKHFNTQHADLLGISEVISSHKHLC